MARHISLPTCATVQGSPVCCCFPNVLKGWTGVQKAKFSSLYLREPSLCTWATPSPPRRARAPSQGAHLRGFTEPCHTPCLRSRHLQASQLAGSQRLGSASAPGPMGEPGVAGAPRLWAPGASGAGPGSCPPLSTRSVTALRVCCPSHGGHAGPCPVTGDTAGAGRAEGWTRHLHGSPRCPANAGQMLPGDAVCCRVGDSTPTGRVPSRGTGSKFPGLTGGKPTGAFPR